VGEVTKLILKTKASSASYKSLQIKTAKIKCLIK